jgi:hypothetical protein
MKRMKSNERQKLYVVRKYVMARSVVEAARKERSAPVHEIFIDEKWHESHIAEAVGFTTNTRHEGD